MSLKSCAVRKKLVLRWEVIYCGKGVAGCTVNVINTIKAITFVENVYIKNYIELIESVVFEEFILIIYTNFRYFNKTFTIRGVIFIIMCG